MSIKELLEKVNKGNLNYDYLENDFVADIFLDNINMPFSIGVLSKAKCEYVMAYSDKDDDTHDKEIYLEDLRELFLNKNLKGLIPEEKKEEWLLKKTSKMPESEKTEILLNLIKAYEKYIELKMINSLIYSAKTPNLKEKSTDNKLTDKEKQDVKIKIELYESLIEDKELYLKFSDFIDYTMGDKRLIIDLLKSRNLETFEKKKINKIDAKNYDTLRENMNEDDINEVLTFFRTIKKKFGFQYENILNDMLVQEEYEIEKNLIEEIEAKYSKKIQVEKNEEREKKAKAILEEYNNKVRNPKSNKKVEEKTEKEETTESKTVVEIKEKGGSPKSKRKVNRYKTLDLKKGKKDKHKKLIEEEEKKIGPKEHVSVLFLNWYFYKGRSFDEVITGEKKDTLFRGIKKLKEKSSERLSIFFFSDEKEDVCLKLLQEFEENLKKYNIKNVILDGITGEHGKFMIDRDKNIVPMYEMPKETFDKIKTLNASMYLEVNQYLDNKNKSYLHYFLPCTDEKGNQIKDYLIMFNRGSFEGRRRNLEYLPVGDSSNEMIVLTKEQTPTEVKKKIEEYYKSKYYFNENDVINRKGKGKEEKGVDKDY